MDTICPPLRWNMVEIGVSRGSYPLLRNFRHLSRMRLKTIVSMIPEPPSADLFQFAKMAGIDLVYIQVDDSLMDLHVDVAPWTIDYLIFLGTCILFAHDLFIL